MDEILHWFETTWLGATTRDVFWLFPSFETLHFMGLCVLFGSLLVIDVRVLGWCRFIPMRSALSYIPVALAAFSVNLLTGIGFFCADPFRYAPNIAFRWKMILILVAGANALWFWLVEHEKMKRLAEGADAGMTAKFIAVLSLVLWTCVIVLGRMIPYVE